MGYNTMEDWYNITDKDIKYHGGRYINYLFILFNLIELYETHFFADICFIFY